MAEPRRERPRRRAPSRQRLRTRSPREEPQKGQLLPVRLCNPKPTLTPMRATTWRSLSKKCQVSTPVLLDFVSLYPFPPPPPSSSPRPLSSLPCPGVSARDLAADLDVIREWNETRHRQHLARALAATERTYRAALSSPAPSPATPPSSAVLPDSASTTPASGGPALSAQPASSPPPAPSPPSATSPPSRAHDASVAPAPSLTPAPTPAQPQPAEGPPFQSTTPLLRVRQVVSLRLRVAELGEVVERLFALPKRHQALLFLGRFPPFPSPSSFSPPPCVVFGISWRYLTKQRKGAMRA